MDIVYHFRVRGTGAEGVHIAGIAHGFRAAGHQVTFVSPLGVDPTRPSEARPAAPAAQGGWRQGSRRLLQRLADQAPQAVFELMELGYNAWALPRLWTRLGATGGQVLYERYAFFNLAGALVSRLRGVPFIVEVNELAGYERVRDQCFVGLARRIERLIFRQADLVVTVSDFLTEKVGEMVGAPANVATIPNGVSAAWLAQADAAGADRSELRARLGLAGRPTIVFVGGLVHWHNFSLLLAAVARVRAHVPTAALLIVGEGAERGFIEQEAARLGLADSVVLAGRVGHDQIQAYIGLADVAIIPETNEYRSPIKLFEYMALGKAVVAPRMAPVTAVVEEGRTALLFAPKDLASLVEQLKIALTDQRLADQIGAEARREIARHYTWEQHARQILVLAKLAPPVARVAAETPLQAAPPAG